MTFAECGYAWAKGLEGVLEDGVALDVFKQWISENNPQARNALDLHFAIKAFSMKTGCCNFIPSTVRKEMSERVHSLSTANPPRIGFFNPCTEHILAHLRKQYETFANSAYFQELCGRSYVIEDIPSTSYTRNQPLSAHQNLTKASHVCMNTAEWGRRTAKMPRPVRPNQNIHSLTVKSGKCEWENQNSFHGEEASKKNFGRRQCDRFGNSFLFSPYVCEGTRFTHEIAEERERFAAILKSKLQIIADLIEQKQRETGKELYARDVLTTPTSKEVSSTAKETTKINEESDSVISEEDLLTTYVEKMNNADSDKQPSARNERRRSTSLSPNPFDGHSHIYTKVTNPYGERGFAPPPGGFRSQEQPYSSCSHSHISQVARSATPLSNGGYGGHRLSDSSGFCSAESANIVNMGALYRKARHIASQDCSLHNTNMARRGFSMHPGVLHAIATLPRQERCSGNFGMTNDDSLLTVSYKEENGEAPFVAKLREREITFREFRHCFGISSKCNKKFFFKSECEDGSAPYQWTTVSDDHAYLPIFQGRVTAECRTFTESD
ncbi:unnamed protein product [Enterobius vermicularis]|uniref:DIX domain-containing protein n=1 Tax=Enterobius vermicularis TaxID=51028 RepID=A0A0N4VIQ5_ENTVE|nr:unnamed protein product [Enterobius vermicularis]